MLQGLKRFQTKSVTEKVTEGVASTTTSSGSSSMGPLFMSAGSSSQGPSIKVENPHFQELLQRLSVVRSAKSQLERLFSQAMDVKVVLEQRASTDAIYKAKLQGYNKSCDSLTSFLQEVREFMFKTEGLDHSCDTKAIMEKALSLIDSSTAHADGIRSLMRRVKAMF